MLIFIPFTVTLLILDHLKYPNLVHSTAGLPLLSVTLLLIFREVRLYFISSKTFQQKDNVTFYIQSNSPKSFCLVSFYFYISCYVTPHAFNTKTVAKIPIGLPCATFATFECYEIMHSKVKHFNIYLDKSKCVLETVFTIKNLHISLVKT